MTVMPSQPIEPRLICEGSNEDAETQSQSSSSIVDEPWMVEYTFASQNPALTRMTILQALAELLVQ
jgi:hypothetical protein